MDRLPSEMRERIEAYRAHLERQRIETMERNERLPIHHRLRVNDIMDELEEEAVAFERRVIREYEESLRRPHPDNVRSDWEAQMRDFRNFSPMFIQDLSVRMAPQVSPAVSVSSATEDTGPMRQFAPPPINPNVQFQPLRFSDSPESLPEGFVQRTYATETGSPMTPFELTPPGSPTGQGKRGGRRAEHQAPPNPEVRRDIQAVMNFIRRYPPGHSLFITTEENDEGGHTITNLQTLIEDHHVARTMPINAILHGINTQYMDTVGEFHDAFVSALRERDLIGSGQSSSRPRGMPSRRQLQEFNRQHPREVEEVALQVNPLIHHMGVMGAVPQVLQVDTETARIANKQRADRKRAMDVVETLDRTKLPRDVLYKIASYDVPISENEIYHMYKRKHGGGPKQSKPAMEITEMIENPMKKAKKEPKAKAKVLDIMGKKSLPTEEKIVMSISSLPKAEAKKRSTVMPDLTPPEQLFMFNDLVSQGVSREKAHKMATKAHPTPTYNYEGQGKVVKMTKKQYMAEHKRLIKMLDEISKQTKAESNKQKAEPEMRGKGPEKHSLLAKLVMTRNADKAANTKAIIEDNIGFTGLKANKYHRRARREDSPETLHKLRKYTKAYEIEKDKLKRFNKMEDKRDDEIERIGRTGRGKGKKCVNDIKGGCGMCGGTEGSLEGGRVYCGKKTPPPRNTTAGSPGECFKKGVGVGLRIKQKQAKMTAEDLGKKTLRELGQLASEMKVSGYGRMKKAELVEALTPLLPEINKMRGGADRRPRSRSRTPPRRTNNAAPQRLRERDDIQREQRERAEQERERQAQEEIDNDAARLREQWDTLMDLPVPMDVIHYGIIPSLFNHDAVQRVYNERDVPWGGRPVQVPRQFRQLVMDLKNDSE